MKSHEPTQLMWRKSSHSSGEDDNSSCIEVAPTRNHGIAARDSKDPHGPALHFTADEWTAFLSRIKQDSVH